MTCCRPRKNKSNEDYNYETVNCSVIAVADANVTLGAVTHCTTLSPREQQQKGDSSFGEIVITPARIPQFRSFVYPERSSSSSISLHEGAQSFRLDSCDSCRYTNHRRRKRKHRNDEDASRHANIENIVQLCKSTFEMMENQSPETLVEDKTIIYATNGSRETRHIPKKLLNDPLTPILSSRQRT